jgi:hypothetical protein
MKSKAPILATQLLHDFINSPLLQGRALKYYDAPVFNRLLSIETGSKPFPIISADKFKAHPIKTFLKFIEETGLHQTEIINDLVDPNRKHPLVEKYKQYLDNREEKEYYYHYILSAVNKFLIATEDLPEWLINDNIFSSLKNEHTRKVYSKAVGEFLVLSKNIEEIRTYLIEKGINAEEITDRFLVSKPAAKTLSEAQQELFFDTKDIGERLLLRLTLIDNVKIDKLLIATVNDFDLTKGTLLGTRLSDQTADIMDNYIRQEGLRRKRDLLFTKPKPALVIFSKRGAIRAGLGEEFYSLIALRPLFLASR